MSKRVKDVGVQDTTGTTHLGESGWTEAYLDVGKYDIDYKIEGGQKVKCSPNGKTYNSLNACLKECRTSLGGFTKICSVDKEETCLTTKINVKFNLDEKVMAMSWNPTKPISSKCNTEKNRWEDAIKTHESKPVQIWKDIVKTANDEWNSKPYKVCADTESTAEVKLEETIREDLGNAITKMQAEEEKKTEEFHKTEDPRGVDCSYCK